MQARKKAVKRSRKKKGFLTPEEAVRVIGPKLAGWGSYVAKGDRGYVLWEDYDLEHDRVIEHKLTDEDYLKFINLLHKKGLISAKKAKSYKEWITRFINLRKDKDAMKKIKAIIRAAKRNPWIGELTFAHFEKVDSKKKLIKELIGGCWAPGTAFLWKNFAFIEQCGCCGEWAVFYYDPKKDRAFQFESITAEWMGKDKLEKFLDRISKASPQQLMNLEY